MKYFDPSRFNDKNDFFNEICGNCEVLEIYNQLSIFKEKNVVTQKALYLGTTPIVIDPNKEFYEICESCKKVLNDKYNGKKKFTIVLK